MTGRQIRRPDRRQMTILGCGGIVCGLIMGSLVSFFLFPSVIRALGIRAKEAGEIQISLHPMVLLLTVALAVLTIYLGSRKPVKLAVSISPLEAAGYRPAQGEDRRP